MEVEYKRAMVDMVLRRLGFSMDYFALPEEDIVRVKVQGGRYSVNVNVPSSSDGDVALCVEKKRFDDAVKAIQDAALQISECYQVVSYTQDVLPFSPAVRLVRYFSKQDGANDFIKTITTEPGLPAPACKTVKTMTHQGKTYALVEIQLESC